jgi:hypothetical protein
MANMNLATGCQQMAATKRVRMSPMSRVLAQMLARQNLRDVQKINQEERRYEKHTQKYQHAQNGKNYTIPSMERSERLPTSSDSNNSCVASSHSVEASGKCRPAQGLIFFNRAYIPEHGQSVPRYSNKLSHQEIEKKTARHSYA